MLVLSIVFPKGRWAVRRRIIQLGLQVPIAAKARHRCPYFPEENLVLVGISARHPESVDIEPYGETSLMIEQLIALGLGAALTVSPTIKPLPVAYFAVQNAPQTEVSDSFDPQDESLSTSDLATEAGTANGIAISCGSDAAPVSSAFNDMLARLRLGKSEKSGLWQQYDQARSSAAMALAHGGTATVCSDLTGLLKSTILDLSKPNS